MALLRMCDRLLLGRMATGRFRDLVQRHIAGTRGMSHTQASPHSSCMSTGFPSLERPNWPIYRRRDISSQSTPNDVDSSSDKVVQRSYAFFEDSTPEKLLELTATYWRRLRCAKPLLLTCNIDKAVECRVVDAVLATGATCQATSDVTALLDRLMLHKESQGIVGCYINVDSLDVNLNAYKEVYESICKCCNSIMVDISVPVDIQPADYARIDEMLTLVKPQVIRFINGTWQYFAAIAPDEMLSQLQEDDTDMAKLNRCNTISERHNAVVIDCDMYPIMMNASDLEGVIFPRSLSILKKVHGFDGMAGAVMAAMLSVSSSTAMLACITSILGVDYSSTKCVDISEGPGSLAVNFVDKIHRISTSPDNLLNHDSSIKFLKRVNAPIDENEGSIPPNSE